MLIDQYIKFLEGAVTRSEEWLKECQPEDKAAYLQYLRICEAGLKKVKAERAAKIGVKNPS